MVATAQVDLPIGAAPVIGTTFPPDAPLYFYLDFMNIAAGARHAAEEQDSPFSGRYVRIHAYNLRRLVQGSRRWMRGFAATALWQRNAGLCQRYCDAGIDLHVYERGSYSGREQGVDQIIQGEMRKLLPARVKRGVIALATGDGNGHQVGEGFIPTLSDLREAGFSIEVYSWRDCLSGALRNWVQGHNGIVIELDRFFRQVTFSDDGGRLAVPFGIKRPR
jgi:hypothetical protein